MIPAIAVPALIALIVKLGLVAYSVRLPLKNWTVRLVLVLLVAFVLHNLAEFFVLCFFSREVTPVIKGLAFAYMALIIPAVALALHVSMRLSFDLEAEDVRAKLQPLLYLPPIVLLYLLLGTDQLVAGFQPFRNTLLRVPGPLYILFEIYLPGYLLTALSVLAYGLFSSMRPAIRRARNQLWLIALLPPCILTWYLIIANHYGFAKITSTIYLPLPYLFFLLVATYATYRYRLIDIGFFIPGSKVRKRKTEFYQQVEALVAQITDIRSVQELLDHVAGAFHCPVVLIGGPRPLTAVRKGGQSGPGVETELARFPREALQKINRMIVTDEIADTLPELHALMKQHRIGAVVPFNSPRAVSVHWLLLGEHFSERVYTPRDFKVVEPLFDRIAQYFLDSSRLLRFQLEDTADSMRDLSRRLALAWDELESLRREAVKAEAESQELHREQAILLRKQLTGIEENLPAPIASGERTLEHYLAHTEAEIVAAALKHCAGDEAKAARLVGMSLDTFRRIVSRRGLDPTQ